MKLTTGQQTSTPNEAGHIRTIRRHAPLLSGIIAAGSLISAPLVIRAEAEASPAPKRECKASVQTGKVDSFSRVKDNGVELKTMLPQKNKYLLVFMPGEYLGDMSKSADSKPESRREAFSKALITQTILRGYEKANGSARPVAYDCVPAEEAVVQPDQSAQPPVPSKRTLDIKDVDEGQPVKPQPPKTDQKQDDKKEAPAPSAPKPADKPPATKKDRYLNLGDNKGDVSGTKVASVGAKTAPEKPPARSELYIPTALAPKASGGDGTQTKPYTVKILIPALEYPSESSFATRDIVLVIPGTGKYYIKLLFVTANAPAESDGSKPSVTLNGLVIGVKFTAASMINVEQRTVDPAALGRPVEEAIQDVRKKSKLVSSYIRD